jgi:glyoxylate reductase
LIIEKVKSGVEGLITTLRDAIDAEVFAAGVGTLKVVAQYAVGFDNINRADANQYKVPFTHTADVLTEATAEYAFFLMGALARKLWSAEHLTRENRWGYWHPYLPFLGDEVTGKTVAVIGTGRIGLALIKKCAGFDMNILCFDPAYENHDYIRAIQEVKDLRFQHGLSRERATIRYTTLHEALRAADFISLHVPLLREGESSTPTYHLINEATLRTMKPNAMIVNTCAVRWWTRPPRPRFARELTAGGSMFTRKSRCPPICRPAIPPSPTVAASRPTSPAPPASPIVLRPQRHGRTPGARTDGRVGRELRRRHQQNALW